MHGMPIGKVLAVPHALYKTKYSAQTITKPWQHVACALSVMALSSRETQAAACCIAWHSHIVAHIAQLGAVWIPSVLKSPAEAIPAMTKLFSQTCVLPRLWANPKELFSLSSKDFANAGWREGPAPCLPPSGERQ